MQDLNKSFNPITPPTVNLHSNFTQEHSTSTCDNEWDFISQKSIFEERFVNVQQEQSQNLTFSISLSVL